MEATTLKQCEKERTDTCIPMTMCDIAGVSVVKPRIEQLSCSSWLLQAPASVVKQPIDEQIKQAFVGMESHSEQMAKNRERPFAVGS